MFRIILYSVICFTMLSPAPANAEWFGPNNYDECIIESMNGVQSELAATLVNQSCLKKFPPQKMKVPSEAQVKLTGQASVGASGKYFSGNIYNGSSDWIIEELIIIIGENYQPEMDVDKSNPEIKQSKFRMLAPDEEVILDRKYKVELNIPPYTIKGFSIPIDNWPSDKQYQWSIYAAYGHK